MDRITNRWYLLPMILILLMLIGKRVNGQVTPKYIEGFGIEHPEVVYKQMMLESGNLKCTNCSWSEHNNPFGFHNGKRYLHYDNLEHSLEGYREWQEWRCPDCETTEDYYKCLIKNWGAPDMIGYVQKLKEI